MSEWQCSLLLADATKYQPDTLDLNEDTKAAEYWFPCFRDLVTKFAAKAASSQSENDNTAVDRAEHFRRAYLSKLKEYEEQTTTNAANNVRLSIRELLELNDTLLRRHGFPDPWLREKQRENAGAVRLLPQRLTEIDAIANVDERWTELVRGVLAGNMFDWGARAVAEILETDKSFGLEAALQRIQQRPWLVDSLDEWQRRMQGAPHKCAVIFVDNSGVDIVLGMLPFARELLRRGTKVILCANTAPSLNDVTSVELTTLLETCTCSCSVLARAWITKRLSVYGNGQRGACLDMRTLPLALCEAIESNETDLLVIEGMGRALHTNLYARFKCETLKLAVIKNKWLAEHLGGETFSVMCKYEPAATTTITTTTAATTTTTTSTTTIS